ncbi:putative DNA-binding regulator [Streptomyces ambofaciens ATCC 23877]|uniref:Transcriptional regulator n=2 Tax=Streptomyces ambofaciens TaxID=1889 RepID=A0ABM6B8Z9_STRAM|nr:MerR family transcriptional regulator [Streptomyces ambofaciens]AKZ60119.1 putative DNA-binding regulator [Streptomyces ambofaciens ATCC 23877]ANB10330.1 transcriptional regulator [Streptomyces ambofaciens]CAJ88224.1 putative DNA-binding regulator [Streptomyces ambofaciens ATCC 23877]
MSVLVDGDDERDGRGGAEGGGLTTGEVARRLGVAPTTVRTWDRRYGLGPEAHTGGRHRRWTPGDVARLERMCALTATGLPPAEAARLARREQTRAPAPRPPAGSGGTGAPARGRSRAGSGLRLGDVRQECKGIARAALRLDAAALDELLLTSIAEHGLVAAWTEVIVPTLQAVGRKWETSGEKYVEVEHFLSWHVSGALRRSTSATVADRPGATTLLACVPGENHTLPLEVLSAALTERGLPVRMFGGALPVESLVAAVRRTGPAAVGLWAQSRTTASRPLAQHVAAMEWGVRGARRRPVVLTLGPGWTGQRAAGLARPAGLAEAVAAVESALSR